MKAIRSLPILATLLTVWAFTSSAVAADIELPIMQTSLNGKMAYEALVEILKFENMPQILEKFTPVQEGIEWTSYPIELNDDVATVRFSYQFVDAPETETPAPVVEEDKSSGGFWGSFKKTVSSSVSAVASAAASALVSSGELIGEVTSSPIPGVNGVEGVQMMMDLKKSNILIATQISSLSLKIIIKNLGTAESPLVQVVFYPSMKAGRLFRGMNDPFVGPLIENQLIAWTNAVKEAALEKQAQLVR